MSDDLVTRLMHRHHEIYSTEGNWTIYLEAAREIRRLREMIPELNDLRAKLGGYDKRDHMP